MLLDNHIKEELSYAYVHAVAARAGFGCGRISQDIGSVDAILSADGGFPDDAALQHVVIQLQLKATCRRMSNEPQFLFPLRIKNYNELRAHSLAPRLLVVLCMPENAAEWLTVDGDSLIARQCAYWCNLKGEPELKNQVGRRVTVRRKNIFSPEAVRELM